MRSKPATPARVLDGSALGVTDEFDDLRAAEIEAVENIKVRQPTTSRIDGHGPRNGERG